MIFSVAARALLNLAFAIKVLILRQKSITIVLSITIAVFIYSVIVS